MPPTALPRTGAGIFVTSHAASGAVGAGACRGAGGGGPPPRRVAAPGRQTVAGSASRAGAGTLVARARRTASTTQPAQTAATTR